MSSLAATQADGYYKPSSYFDSGDYKKKSVSAHAGSKGTNQSELLGVVRFELPIHGVCTNCDHHIRKGTRFNAKKDHVDDYYSTKIYKFVFKCYECKKTCEVRNDPKNADYVYLNGLRKKVQEFDTAEAGSLGVFDTESMRTSDHNSTMDAMERMEKNLEEENNKAFEQPRPVQHHQQQQQHPQQQQPQQQLPAPPRQPPKPSAAAAINALIRHNNTIFKDDVSSNAALRSQFRSDRGRKKTRLAKGAAMGLALEVSDETEADRAKAGLVTYGEVKQAVKKEKERFKSVRGGSIFSSAKKKTATTRAIAQPKNVSERRNELRNERENSLRQRPA